SRRSVAVQCQASNGDQPAAAKPPASFWRPFSWRAGGPVKGGAVSLSTAAIWVNDPPANRLQRGPPVDQSRPPPQAWEGTCCIRTSFSELRPAATEEKVEWKSSDCPKRLPSQVPWAEMMPRSANWRSRVPLTVSTVPLWRSSAKYSEERANRARGVGVQRSTGAQSWAVTPASLSTVPGLAAGT